MSGTIDDEYLEWLSELIGGQNGGFRKSYNYWRILRAMYSKEFVWIVNNDENRIEEGKDLRWEFIAEEEIGADWLEMGCSVLEMMIALSRRIAFQAEGEPHEWFWHMMKNLGISTHTSLRRLDEILECLIWRGYDPDGNGGLFPLEHAEEDQRYVEIWYQLQAYLIEHE